MNRWIVVTLTEYSDHPRPTGAVGPFDDYRAATLWCDRIGYTYGTGGTAVILEMAWVHMRSEDGPPVLVAAE